MSEEILPGVAPIRRQLERRVKALEEEIAELRSTVAELAARPVGGQKKGAKIKAGPGEKSFHEIRGEGGPMVGNLLDWVEKGFIFPNTFEYNGKTYYKLDEALADELIRLAKLVPKGLKPWKWLLPHLGKRCTPLEAVQWLGQEDGGLDLDWLEKLIAKGEVVLHKDGMVWKTEVLWRQIKISNFKD